MSVDGVRPCQWSICATVSVWSVWASVPVWSVCATVSVARLCDAECCPCHVHVWQGGASVAVRVMSGREEQVLRLLLYGKFVRQG